MPVIDTIIIKVFCITAIYSMPIYVVVVGCSCFVFFSVFGFQFLSMQSLIFCFCFVFLIFEMGREKKCSRKKGSENNRNPVCLHCANNLSKWDIYCSQLARKVFSPTFCVKAHINRISLSDIFFLFFLSLIPLSSVCLI